MRPKPISRDLFPFYNAATLKAHAAHLNAIRAEESARRSCNNQTTRIIRRK